MIKPIAADTNTLRSPILAAVFGQAGLLVGATLLLALEGVRSGRAQWVLALLQYLESLVGTYAVMATLPP